MAELRKHHHFLRLINLEQINSSFIKKWKMKKDKKKNLFICVQLNLKNLEERSKLNYENHLR